MVRFNQRGYFNTWDWVINFHDVMKEIVVNVNMSVFLKSKNIIFINHDFLNYKDNDTQRLLILDPPYILRKDMYDTDYTEKHDATLLNLIANTKNDFIYFNYLYRDGVVNKKLDNIIKNNNFKVININNKTLAGQGRSENIKDVQEVIITNVTM